MISDPLLGRIIDDKYRIDAEIGAGGMATIYRATRLKIGDDVAIKILHAELLREPKFAERFQREAQAAARLKHPNVVTVHDFGVSEDGVIYFVMELVEGPNLRTVIKDEGPMTTAAAAEIVRQVCAALTEAHRQGIIHRDIKPANIAVNATPDGMRVKVLDFGIASLRGGTMMTFTQTGTVMGTPAYMSPEQCMGEDLDGRSDIYSLGVVLFEMLAGVVPFNSPTATAVVMQQVQQAPPPLRVLNVSVSAAVEDVVLRALAKRREDRPQLAKDLADELSAAVAGTGPLQAAAGTDFATDRFAPSHFDRTMVQSSFRPPERSVGPAHRGPLIGAIVALALVAVLGTLWFGMHSVFSGRASASRAVAANPPRAKPTRMIAARSAPKHLVAAASQLAPLPRARAVPRAGPYGASDRGIRSAPSEAVRRYYALLNIGDYADAYALLSPDFQRQLPFYQWRAGYATTIQSVADVQESDDPSRVPLRLVARDRNQGYVVTTIYGGTWSLVSDGRGGWLLDHGRLHRISTHY